MTVSPMATQTPAFTLYNNIFFLVVSPLTVVFGSVLYSKSPEPVTRDYILVSLLTLEPSRGVVNW
jgi:hypothetical protein